MDNFDYIDFIQNKKLQKNLAECDKQTWEDKDAPKDVLDRVKEMGRAMADPDLVKKMVSGSLEEETQFDLDPEGDAMNRCNEALQDDGWIPDGMDTDGCFFYKKAGVHIRVKVELVNE